MGMDPTISITFGKSEGGNVWIDKFRLNIGDLDFPDVEASWRVAEIMK